MASADDGQATGTVQTACASVGKQACSQAPRSRHAAAIEMPVQCKLAQLPVNYNREPSGRQSDSKPCRLSTRLAACVQTCPAARQRQLQALHLGISRLLLLPQLFDPSTCFIQRVTNSGELLRQYVGGSGSVRRRWRQQRQRHSSIAAPAAQVMLPLLSQGPERTSSSSAQRFSAAMALARLLSLSTVFLAPTASVGTQLRTQGTSLGPASPMPAWRHARQFLLGNRDLPLCHTARYNVIGVVPMHFEAMAHPARHFARMALSLQHRRTAQVWCAFLPSWSKLVLGEQRDAVSPSIPRARQSLRLVQCNSCSSSSPLR